MKQNVGKIEIEPSPDLMRALKKLFRGRRRPSTIIETGTYLGKGSTRTIIKAIEEGKAPKNYQPDFQTIEANKAAFEKAVENLKPWPWVTVNPGLSVKKEDAIQFIMNDEMINHHDRWPDLYIDCTKDPRLMYLTEISREGTGHDPADNLLPTLIEMYKDNGPILFVLDSCGGIGYLEFQTVVKKMGDKGFYLFLDDAKQHIKHYRSFLEIQENADGRWKVLFEDDRLVIAERLPA